MNLKNILLTLIVIVMVPEIMLTAYVFNLNPMTFDISRNYAGDFTSFLLHNPLFFVIVLLIVIVMFILYFALRAR